MCSALTDFADGLPIILGGDINFPLDVSLDASSEIMKRKWLEKLKKVEELASQYKRHPISSTYKPKLSRPWQPSSVWRLFPRQAAAFQFGKTCKEDVHVFALETVLDDTERRLYLVTTYAEFWFYYMKWPRSLAHCYEVIPADTVCKLYFDLEYYKPANPGADGKKMVALVIEFFCKKLEDCFGVKCSADYILNLDSSTEEKFSRHLIFLLPNAGFKDNIHVGNFIKSALQPLLSLKGCMLTAKASMCERSINDLNEHCGSDEKNPQEASPELPYTAHRETFDLSPLLVQDKNGGIQLFIDLGKNVTFEVAEDNRFAVKPLKHVSEEEQIFLCSLISNVRFTDSLKVLTCECTENERSGTSPLSAAPSVITGCTMKGYQFSPYPEIDCFILSLLTREGFHGGIRQWNYFSTEELLVYDTVNYRWCKNVGRAHRSNNVMLLVDLKREMWYQKCHDPVCRAQNFKSQFYPLPTEVCLPFIFKEDGEECSLAMDENGNIRDIKQNVLTEELAVGKSMETQSEEDITIFDTAWGCCIDDASIVEAAEDAELVDAAELSLEDWSVEETDIPDELLLQAVDAHHTSEET
ncbi:DNA-directed primase/polymerase protein isoform X2 [Bufo gargarizans]|uniref:DNA-directed primase/polymerase protein isoform X2 n=1 Tax=Bufo gargarizans TaxID=30331 RepID=UPI001CF48DFD|nr:DNA-directed primase/polymerase protein isoform X2 [Bufo gargarizans]